MRAYHLPSQLRQTISSVACSEDSSVTQRLIILEIAACESLYAFLYFCDLAIHSKFDAKAVKWDFSRFLFTWFPACESLEKPLKQETSDSGSICYGSNPCDAKYIGDKTFTKAKKVPFHRLLESVNTEATEKFGGWGFPSHLGAFSLSNDEHCNLNGWRITYGQRSKPWYWTMPIFNWSCLQGGWLESLMVQRQNCFKTDNPFPRISLTSWGECFKELLMCQQHLKNFLPNAYETK